jgi:hypothetical protein
MVALVLAVLGGCAAETDGESGGSVVVWVSGGVEAREGRIPAEDFADGYSVTIDHAVLSVSDFVLRASDGESAGLDVQPVLVELVPDRAEAFSFDGIPARRWDEVGYVSAPPSADVRKVNVADDVAARMIEEGWSFYTSGIIEAPPGTVDAVGAPISSIPYEIGLPVRASYAQCSNGVDGTLGVVVSEGTTTEAEITWHLTHTWFDSYAEDASLRAEAIAAGWDGEGPVTLEDLADQRLTNLEGIDGQQPMADEVGNPILYIPGASGAETLEEFVLATRFGHFNGLEGFCMTELETIQ